MENESREQRTIQGEYNLRMGAYLARRELERQVEAAGKDESLPSMSDEAAQRIEAAMMANYDALQREEKHRKYRGKLVWWAVAVAAALVLTSTVALNVSASRTALVNYVIQNFDEYSVVRYDQEYNALAPLGWRSEYYPQWLPEGCKVNKVKFKQSGDYVWYSSPDGYDFSVSIEFPPIELALNTEDCEEKEISINGRNAMIYFTDHKRRIILFIPLQDCSVQIEGNLTEKEACEIAKSINGV